jgi:predicted nucleic acid-binding protein
MLVISNTSPLLYLNLTGHLRLLPDLYGEIATPPAVQKAKAAGLLPSIRPVVKDLRQAGLWLSEDLVATVLMQAGERGA